MITFLPCTDFAMVATLLDDKRLGGQRTEAWAILKWLRDPAKYPKLVKAGLSHHPHVASPDFTAT